MFRVWVATQERERRCREAGVEMYLPAPDLRPPCVPFSLVGASAAADAVCLRVDMVTRMPGTPTLIHRTALSP